MLVEVLVAVLHGAPGDDCNWSIPKFSSVSRSLKFVRLKILYVSHRNWIERFSPHRKFLNKAMSVLKMPGRRATFRAGSPISPSLVGLPKHSGFKKAGVPSLSVPVKSVGSAHVTKANAFDVPPVKSVIGAHGYNPAFVPVAIRSPLIDPAGQLDSGDTLIVVLANSTVMSLGFPVAKEVGPEFCNPPKIACINLL